MVCSVTGARSWSQRHGRVVKKRTQRYGSGKEGGEHRNEGEVAEGQVYSAVTRVMLLRNRGIT